MIDSRVLDRAVRAALEEDLGAEGDITSVAVIDAAARARGRIVARQPLVVAGVAVARAVFATVDPSLRFQGQAEDGEARKPGDLLAVVEGGARAILAGERTALNFLQRMCGIATATRRLVDDAGGRIEIADTRKTAPGLRAFDKEAVRAGGGVNHRAGLFDGILIKDNHWRLAGGPGAAVRRARAAPGAGPRPLEVEVGTPEEAEEALAAGAEALLLDNMDEATLRRTLTAVRGRAFVEVSGGLGPADVPRLAALGVDRVSFGALTHSVRAADLALELEPA